MVVDPLRAAEQVALEMLRGKPEVLAVLRVATRPEGAAWRGPPDVEVPLRGGLEHLSALADEAAQRGVGEGTLPRCLPRAHEDGGEAGMLPDVEEELPFVDTEVHDAGTPSVIACPVAHGPAVLHIPPYHTKRNVASEDAGEVSRRAIKVEGQIKVPRRRVGQLAPRQAHEVGERVAVHVFRELLDDVVPCKAGKVQHLLQAPAARWG
mmetsp:Transcript_62003/g.184698  ORF Transcript_62003/g.184698 Transcript_62003/m.184698 type:complete len:208 (+) Transcript_62003:158-781(+)